MSEAGRVIQGIKWNYAAMAAQMLAQLAFTAVVARLLDPVQFGVMAMATVVIRFGSYLSGAGIRSYLIQKPALSRGDVQAAFLLTGVVGALFCAATMRFAGWVSHFFDSPDVEPVLRVLAVAFLVNGLAITPTALLQRALRFRGVATIETTAYVVGYLGIGLPLAFHDYGVWALVAAALSQQAIMLALYLIISPERMGLSFSLSELRQVACTGSHFAANSILDYCVTAAPTLIIGRHMGEAALGTFNRAATLVQLPTYAVSAAVSKVVLPYLAPLQADPARLKHAYARSATLSAMVFVPLCLGMIPAAHEIVVLVLGEQWVAGVPAFQVLALAMTFNLLTVQLGTCAEALRKLTALTFVALVTLGVMGLAMYGLMHRGLEGAAWGVAIGEVARFTILIVLIRHWLGMSAAAVVTIYMPAVFTGLAVALVTATVRELLSEAAVAVTLALQVLGGGAAFGLCVLIYPHTGFKAAVASLISHVGFVERLPLAGALLRRSRLAARP